MEFTLRYEEKEIIGKGNFGTAQIVIQRSTRKLFVAKKIVLSNLNEMEQAATKREADVLKFVSHPNIVNYEESFLESHLLIIVMEYCPGGDLSQVVKSHREKGLLLDESQVLKWLGEVANALSYLHSNKVLHRDIKSSNVYLTANGKVKIGDFGIAKILANTNDVAKTIVGTPYYMSPEVCENKPYSGKSDVWSLGCLAYELCALQHPFTGNTLLGLMMKILKEHPSPLEGYSNELNQLIFGMLTKPVSERYSLEEVLNCPLLLESPRSFNHPPVKQTYNLVCKELPEYTPGLSEINPLELVDQTLDSLQYSKSTFNASEFCREMQQSSESEYSEDFESDEEEDFPELKKLQSINPSDYDLHYQEIPEEIEFG